MMLEEAQRYADPNEFASAVEEAHNAASVARFRERATAPETHPDFDGVNCVDCDTAMPPERLAAQRVRCTACQTIVEFNQKMRGGFR